MKVNALRTWHLSSLAILTVSAILACDYVEGAQGVPPDPPQQIPPVIDAVETASQSEARTVLIADNLGFSMHDVVAKTFLRTANIKLEYHETNPNLPAPIGSADYPHWPDVGTPGGLSVYQDYAKFHHDEQNYPWILFYVNHYAGTSTTSCTPYVLGVANPRAGDNVVQPNPDDRWSFNFITDIQQQEQVLCKPGLVAQQLQNQVAHVVAHEYGHQRAGLTDFHVLQNPPGNGFYHTGPVPKDRQDVMASPMSYTELWNRTDPVFDGWGNESAGDHSTCRGNLITNRSVH
jgi:hypothetical protein